MSEPLSVRLDQPQDRIVVRLAGSGTRLRLESAAALPDQLTLRSEHRSWPRRGSTVVRSVPVTDQKGVTDSGANKHQGSVLLQPKLLTDHSPLLRTRAVKVVGSDGQIFADLVVIPSFQVWIAGSLLVAVAWAAERSGSALKDTDMGSAITGMAASGGLLSFVLLHVFGRKPAELLSLEVFKRLRAAIVASAVALVGMFWLPDLWVKVENATSITFDPAPSTLQADVASVDKPSNVFRRDAWSRIWSGLDQTIRGRLSRTAIEADWFGLPREKVVCAAPPSHPTDWFVGGCPGDETARDCLIAKRSAKCELDWPSKPLPIEVANVMKAAGRGREVVAEEKVAWAQLQVLGPGLATLASDLARARPFKVPAQAPGKAAQIDMVEQGAGKAAGWAWVAAPGSSIAIAPTGSADASTFAVGGSQFECRFGKRAVRDAKSALFTLTTSDKAMTFASGTVAGRSERLGEGSTDPAPAWGCRDDDAPLFLNEGRQSCGPGAAFELVDVDAGTNDISDLAGIEVSVDRDPGRIRWVRKHPRDTVALCLKAGWSSVELQSARDGSGDDPRWKIVQRANRRLFIERREVPCFVDRYGRRCTARPENFAGCHQVAASQSHPNCRPLYLDCTCP